MTAKISPNVTHRSFKVKKVLFVFFYGVATSAPFKTDVTLISEIVQSRVKPGTYRPPLCSAWKVHVFSFVLTPMPRSYPDWDISHMPLGFHLWKHLIGSSLVFIRGSEGQHESCSSWSWDSCRTGVGASRLDQSVPRPRLHDNVFKWK